MAAGLGGAHEGTRLNKLYRRDVDVDAIVAVLSSLFEATQKNVGAMSVW
jgi:hypothetical protein